MVATPSWNADEVELVFYFIREQAQADSRVENWNDLSDKWLGLITPTGRFKSVDGGVVTYEDLTAKDYRESKLLDLDHLSSSAASDL